MTEGPLLRLTMPVPPSTNNLYVARRDGKGRAKTSEYEAWQEKTGWTIKAQLVGKHNGAFVCRPLRVLIEAPFSRRRDIDNCKPVLDVLKYAGVIVDDRWVDDLRVVRVPKGGDLAVSIWRME